MSTLAAEVAPGDRVIFDLTHGLRHLAVLGLVAALYLRAARQATVEAVYYGALDLRFNHESGHAPVLRLDGLLEIVDWIQALEGFDKDGDYGLFVPLLRRQGISHAALVALRQAAFLERTARIGEAKGALARFREETAELSTLDAPASLFNASLEQRLAWSRLPGHYGRQRELAMFHLEHGDYLRAALFGLEAVVTRLTLESGGEPNRQSDREAAVQNMLQSADCVLGVDEAERSDGQRALVEQSSALRALRALRDALVHADHPRSGEVVDALRSEDRTRKALSRWLELLLPDHAV